jgi:hypothetical protein
VHTRGVVEANVTGRRRARRRRDRERRVGRRPARQRLEIDRLVALEDREGLRDLRRGIEAPIARLVRGHAAGARREDGHGRAETEHTPGVVVSKVTGRPELAEAERPKGGSPKLRYGQRPEGDGLARLADVEALGDLRRRVVVGVARLVRVDGAGAGPMMVTVVPETLHTPGVAVVKVTGSPSSPSR